MIKINFIKQLSGNYILDNSIAYTKEEAIFIKKAVQEAVKNIKRKEDIK
jgi:hypothetical protein